jgi:hypothetical protein
VPEAPALFNHNDPEKFPDVARLQTDLMVMALACDLTRVGSIMFARANNNMLFPWLGIHEGHHDLSHHGDSDIGANEQLTRINHWFAEQFAYLLGRLKAVPTPPGSRSSTPRWSCGVNEQGQGEQPLAQEHAVGAGRQRRRRLAHRPLRPLPRQTRRTTTCSSAS